MRAIINEIKTKKSFYWPLFVLFAALLSRFIFLNDSIDFFDSNQYIWRSKIDSLSSALSTGHAPYHPGYVFWGWFFHHILKIKNVAFALCLPSAIFGSGTIFVFYLLARRIYTNKVALVATLFLAINPFLWIANISILVDSTMIFFYILSLYLFWRYLESKHFGWIFSSGLSLGLSVFAHTQVAFWLLGFPALYLFWWLTKKEFINPFKFWPMVIGIIIFIGFYLYLLVTSGHNPDYLEALRYLAGGNAGDHQLFSLQPAWLNFSSIMTYFGAFLSLAAFVYLARRHTISFVVLGIWLVPGLIISALYLYTNLFGRSSLIGLFPASLALALFATSSVRSNFLRWLKNLLVVGTFACTLLVSLPLVLQYGTKASPFQELGAQAKKLNQNGLYLTANQFKTFLEYSKYDVVWETPQNVVEDDIKKSIESGGSFFIDQGAIFFPYWQYDGQSWKIDTTYIGAHGWQHGSLVGYLFSDFSVEAIWPSASGYKTAIIKLTKNSQDVTKSFWQSFENLPPLQDLVFGHIKDSAKGSNISQVMINVYSDKFLLKVAPERLNYRDVGFWLWRGWRTKDPLSWTYSDKDGNFLLAIPHTQAKQLQATVTSFPNIAQASFTDSNLALPKRAELAAKGQVKSGKVGTLDELRQLLSQTRDSYWMSLQKDGTYKLTEFVYELPMTTHLEAEDLSSAIGEIKIDSVASNGSVRQSGLEEGFLIFGPWINLPPGKYQIIYRFSRQNLPEIAQPIVLDVTKDIGAATIVSKMLEPKDLTLDQYQDVTLDFEIHEISPYVEFRVKVPAGLDLSADYLELKRLD